MNRVTVEFPSFQDFLQKCSPLISEKGMFLSTDEVQPVGAQVGFYVGLGADFPILRGAGEVVWVVEPDPQGIGSPGMALRYTETDDATERLIRKIAERHRERSGEVFALDRPDETGQPGEAGAAEAPSEPPAAVPEEAAAAAAALAASVPSAGEADATEAAASAGDVLSLPEDDQDGESVVEAAPATVEETALEEAVAPATPVAPAVHPPELAAAMAASEEPPRAGRAGLWAVLALVAIAALGYWQRDLLTGMMGMGSEEPGSAAVEEPLETVDVEPETAALVESAIEEPAGDDSTGEPVVEELGAATETASIAAPPERPPLTRIEDISWLAGEGSTLLMLRADGSFGEGSYQVDSLGGETPRAILKISGVTSPYEAGTTEVATAEVLRVRTGLHPSELHVVLDLASPEARVTSTEVDGVVLQVRVSTGSASP